MESLLAQLTDTYSRPATEEPRLSVWDPQLCLAIMYRDENRLDRAIECALKSLDALGFVVEGGRIPQSQATRLVVRKWGYMVEPVAKCWLLLAVVYRELMPELESQAMNYARISYNRAHRLTYTLLV